jgi:hypothetical protein
MPKVVRWRTRLGWASIICVTRSQKPRAIGRYRVTSTGQEVAARMRGFRPSIKDAGDIKADVRGGDQLGTLLYASSRTVSEGFSQEVTFLYSAIETIFQVRVPLGLMYICAGQADFGLEVMRRT